MRKLMLVLRVDLRFCLVYRLFGLVIPATLALVAVLMFFSSAREVLFPRETSFDPSTSKSEQIEEATHDFFDGVM